MGIGDSLTSGASVGADILSALPEASFRDIAFPIVLASAKGSHRLVHHVRQDRDGTFVENTGRNGYAYTFRIPCINTIRRGPTETWQGKLFPDVYRQLITAFEDRSTGTFKHPIHGERACKAVEWEETIDPEFRGGPTLVVSLAETVDDADADAVGIADTSTFAMAVQAAADLDQTFMGMNPPPDTGTPRGMSLKDFLTFIGSIADQWNLFKAQWEAAIGRVTHQMEGLAAKFGGEPGFSDNTQRLLSALHTAKLQAMLRTVGATSLYVVPKATTLAVVAVRTRNTPAQLLQLNPGLRGRVVVPAITPVRYYGRV